MLGWEILKSTRDHLLLTADSRVGMPAQLLFKREAEGVLFATFIQFDNAAVRAEWALIARPHRQVVAHLLRQAARAG